MRLVYRIPAALQVAAGPLLHGLPLGCAFGPGRAQTLFGFGSDFGVQGRDFALGPLKMLAGELAHVGDAFEDRVVGMAHGMVGVPLDLGPKFAAVLAGLGQGAPGAGLDGGVTGLHVAVHPVELLSGRTLDVRVGVLSLTHPLQDHPFDPGDDFGGRVEPPIRHFVEHGAVAFVADASENRNAEFADGTGQIVVVEPGRVVDGTATTDDGHGIRNPGMVELDLLQGRVQFQPDLGCRPFALEATVGVGELADADPYGRLSISSDSGYSLSHSH